MVKGNSLQLKRIQNPQGQWLETKEEIVDEAVRFYQAQFHETEPHGFFHSTVGVKQGEPLSPTLFIFAYTDDTIIFSSSCEISLGLIMNVWSKYKQASGQLIDKAKSLVYLHDKVDEEVFQKVERVTGIARKEFPLMYLGCPSYYSKYRLSFYSELIAKVRNRLQGWKRKLLTKPSFWSSFMSNKYLKKNNPILVPWNEGLYIWRKMLQVRDLIDHQTWWQLRIGSSLFWFDNWIGLGPLYFLTPLDFYCNEEINNVSDVMTEWRWHVPAIRNNLLENLTEYILNEVQPPARGDELDMPWWMLETRG
ncbi:uncharacterized protein LOC132035065 [Lycium ferocissimum]|uniref:uncharacterized protein LOC132035065 n=1 Tax=Lycium ferocissimum TaxID=112874 RepID=UPI00281566CB|nr:uncharacterized protein LOC132035065 [Lycium ferocissimum]